ncbi:TPA: hypothetical protein ACSP3S_004002 [Aeromonas veronii]
MEHIDLIRMSQQLDNWMPVRELPEHYPQFSRSTLKTLFWKREERPGLSRCARMVGKQMFVNVPMFGLWLGGQLPEQMGE